jgi:pilus assembly protein Flp/PilA
MLLAMLFAQIEYARTQLNNAFTQEEGQGLVEYALIIALIAVVLVGALTALNGGIGGTFNTITTKLGGAP